MPVSLPESIYENSQNSLSGLPIAFERILTKLCFYKADSVIAASNATAQKCWLKSIPQIKNKLNIVQVTVEEYPTPYIYDKRALINYDGNAPSN